MSIHRDSTFPRSRIPPDLAAKVRAERLGRRWSQEKLAAKVGVCRRTIIRLELGQHRPTAHLVHDLEEALDLLKLVPTWPEPLRPSIACYGPRVRQLRLAARVTAARAAQAAGVSAATFSRFEAGATVKALVGVLGEWNEGIKSDSLAILLGFPDASALSDHCER